MKDRPNNINVFILYAKEDENLKKELVSHLSMLQRNGFIDIWHEGQVLPGKNKNKLISEYLDKSHLILLLISANFLSPDCYGQYEEELRAAYKRQSEGKVKIIPVILRYCIWQMDLLESLNPLPKGGHPVSSKHWESSDLAFLNITNGLKQIASNLVAASKRIVKASEKITKEREIKQEDGTLLIPPKDLSERDQIAEQLINRLFSLFETWGGRTNPQEATYLVHKSLVASQKLKQDFYKHNFLKAYQNFHLYQIPIKIESSKPTGRTSMGRLSEREKGEEVKYLIARKKDIGALSGYIRIFFPSNGGAPTISNLSL